VTDEEAEEMGYGAALTVVNKLSQPVRLFVTDVQCMFDNGDQGSRLASLFNNAVVPAGWAFPSMDGQYIEEDGSGDCFTKYSTFDLKVYEEPEGSDSVYVGSATIKEYEGNYWQESNTNDQVIQVTISNDSPQARIVVGIADS
jgi:hypothetical protein